MNDLFSELSSDGFVSPMGQFIHKLLRCCYLAPVDISSQPMAVSVTFTDGTSILIPENSFRELAALPDSVFSQALMAYMQYEPVSSSGSILQGGNAD